MTLAVADVFNPYGSSLLNENARYLRAGENAQILSGFCWLQKSSCRIAAPMALQCELIGP